MFNEPFYCNNDNYYTINPAYEFVEDEKGIVVFDEKVGNIFRSNMVGKVIINTFKTRQQIDSAIDYLNTVFDQVNNNELEYFIKQLISNQIIIQS